MDTINTRSVVSLALGRPFAIQDDDITVEACLYLNTYTIEAQY